jgi:hypothetical protein
MLHKDVEDMTDEEYEKYLQLVDESYKECPFYVSQNGGPKDLPGAYGPGTCMGGCIDEPVCMT